MIQALVLKSPPHRPYIFRGPMVKPTRPLLVVGVSDPQAVENYGVSAGEAGAEMVVVESAEEAEAWLENHDPMAIALDMMSEGAESSCLGIRGIGRLAHVPIIGLAPELNELVFP